jgi:hypothetical protein
MASFAPVVRARVLRFQTLFVLLLLIAFGLSYAVAQDYPPYGPHVPTAQFDHVIRPQLTPPAVSLLNDGTGRVAQSAWNTELVGYDTLDGRSTYQPLVVHQGNRYIAYMAHHATVGVNRLNGQVEPSGTSILDVTEPEHPIYLFHIPGPAGSIDAAGSQMVHVCGGDMLPSSSPEEKERKHGRWYMLRSHGNSSGLATPIESHEIYDVTNPSKPEFLVTVVGLLSNTHKSYWECDTGIAYLVANDPTQGWQHSGSTQHLKIYNLHDPANPEYIRDFGLVGQQPTANPAAPGYVQEGPVTPPSGVHGPISAGVEKNRLYMAYGVGGNGVLQILDRNKVLTGCVARAGCATSPTQAEMLAPQKGFFTLLGLTLQGGHTSFPIFGEEDGKPRNLLLVSSEEGGNECTAGSAPHALWLYDITNEAHPRQISVNAKDPALTLLDVANGFDGVTFNWVSNGLAGNLYSGVYPTNLTPQDPVPQPNSFCNQGGRFGAHSPTELFYPKYYGKLAIAAWFAGGLRVFDIRNPDHAGPIAYFVPAPNDTGCGPKGGPSPGPGCTFANAGRDNHMVNAIQSNNVELDDSGYIYVADRAGTGMHIVKLTGDAAKAVQ